MLVSFLVPVYNVEKYLKQCVESLLGQKGATYEIVLLDDGSTDNSGKICDEYAERHPEIVRVIHKENEGLLMTRRRGFKEARGDWFICVDSDDYVDEKLLGKVVATIRKHDCDMVMYNYQYADDNGKKTPSRLRLKDGTVYTENNKKELYLTRLFTTSINNMWLRAVRRDIVDIEVDYSDCEIRNMCEDAIQVLPLYTNTKKTVYIDQNLYYYRKNQESITGRVSWETWRAINKSFVITEKYLNIWNIAEEDRKRFYTKQMEGVCNCIRWIFNNDENDLDMQNESFIGQLKVDTLFCKCKEYFRIKYCSTKYMKLSVPIIIQYLEKMNLKGLKKYFLIERKLLNQ